MAKARTTLTMQIRVKLPVGVNAQDMMQFVRARISGLPGEIPSDMPPAFADKVQEAIRSEDTKVSLVQKLTEYK